MKLLLTSIIFLESGNFWTTNSFLIEQIILVVVVIFQIRFFLKTLSDTYTLKGIFKNNLNEIKVKFDKLNLKIMEPTDVNITTEEGQDRSLFDPQQNENIIDISLVETSGKNDIILRMRNMINTYLINNYGAAVNFSIIKDIIDREVDVKDDEISQSIPTPLYLGLAATMLGIIFGFMAMPDIDKEGTNFTDGINSLIEGVKYAMGASLLGLVLTTILSSGFYKGAKRKSLKDKNDQLSYLQAKLLPELIKAEDTGVSGLKQSLDHFSRKATKIVQNVENASVNTANNLRAQQNVLDRIENLNMTKVSKINLELFDKLDENMNAFNKFSDYLSIMEEISMNLKDFASRTNSVDILASQIGSTLNESKKLSQYLTAHFDKIESAGNHALDAVNYADSHFRNSIEMLTEEIKERINKMNTSASLHESDLRATYEKIGSELNQLTSEHVQVFTNAYAGAVPHFEQLDNLKELGSIKNTVKEEAESLKNVRAEQNGQIIHKVTELNDSINQLKRDINAAAGFIINKSTDKNKRIKSSPKPPDVTKNPTLIKKFGNLFRFRKNSKTKSKSKKENHQINDFKN